MTTPPWFSLDKLPVQYIRNEGYDRNEENTEPEGWSVDDQFNHSGHVGCQADPNGPYVAVAGQKEEPDCDRAPDC